METYKDLKMALMSLTEDELEKNIIIWSDAYQAGFSLLAKKFCVESNSELEKELGKNYPVLYLV